MTNNKNWSAKDIPDLKGKHIIVTGGNRGLGFASVLEFAKNGAHVVLTCRSIEKGKAACEEILQKVPNASLDTMELDCSSFDSVRAFVKKYQTKYSKLDVLLNNAGISRTDDKKITTQDGHELTWQTNVWSVCLLSQLLLPNLAEGSTNENPSRIVFNVSSTATLPEVELGDLDDIDVNALEEKSIGDKGKYWSYPLTKCASWMISNALHKRLEQSATLKGRVLTACAHPGYSISDMTARYGAIHNKLFGMPASQGCLSQVRVATDPNVVSGAFYGPNTRTKFDMQHIVRPGHNAEPELYGYPMPSAFKSKFASNEELCEKLLKKSEQVIGATFDI